MDVLMNSLEDYKIKTKKVSFNAEIQSIELADDLAKLLKIKRTTILMTLIGLGLSDYIKYLKENWEKLKKSRPEKVQKINKLLKELSEIEKKHIKRSY